MKIVNLTGRPQWMPTTIDELCCEKLDELEYPNFNFLFRRFRNALWQENEKIMLNECPVFLVETYKSRVYNKITGQDIAVLVPSPMSEKTVAKQVTEDSQEAGMILEDYLGVYIYNPGAVLEHSIFIWVDRIQDAVQQDPENFQALTTQVILHEYAHFLMNPASYGDTVGSAYSNLKWECKYVEEACANAFSLAICYDSMTPKQQTFIEGFTNSQPQQYAAGWSVFSDHEAGYAVNGWMQVKVLMDTHMLQELNIEVDWVFKHKGDEHLAFFHMLDKNNLYWPSPDCTLCTELHKFAMRLTRNEMTYSDDGIHFGIMNDKGISITNPIFEAIETAGSIDGKRVYAVKKGGKFAVITLEHALTDFSYDYVWSFGDDRICQVAIDKDGERKYGYIDETGEEIIHVLWNHLYNFENGLTTAKLGKCYHIIDRRGVIVVADLPYQDLRAFHNGYALAKRDGKWGYIDYQGNEVVECKYEFNKLPEL